MTTAAPEALAAAQAAVRLCAAQSLPSPCLLLVPTPIGNLADIGLRALALLARCDRVAAEDTRMAQRLLQAYGLHKPLLRADRHREQAAAEALLQHLAAGERVAFVSDAGTPGINDPGAALVRAARAAGHAVVPLPGPSAVTTALSASGFALDSGYSFVGYVPSSAQQRDAFWRAQLDAARAVVCLETPHRIEASLRALHLASGEAQPRVLLAKELSKQFEALVDGTPQQLLDWLAADAQRLHGEFVLVLQPGAAAAPERAQARRWLLRLTRELPASRAAAVVAELFDTDRKALYAWLLEQQRDAR